jgi:peptidoglycan/LPS O-acetylase OafA/YrhL
VFFYLMFGALLLGRRIGLLAFALWAGCIVFGQSVETFPFTFFAHPLFIKYLVGMLVALAVRRWAVPLPRTVALLGVAAMLVTNHLQLREGFGYTMTLSWGYTLGSALVLLGVVQADRAGGLPAPAPLAWLGDASYSVYLVHFPALSVLAKFAKTASLDAHVPGAVLFFGLAAGAVGCACVFHLLVERPLNSLARLPWRRTAAAAPGIATSDHDRYKPAA